MAPHSLAWGTSAKFMMVLHELCDMVPLSATRGTSLYGTLAYNIWYLIVMFLSCEIVMQPMTIILRLLFFADILRTQIWMG